MNILKLDMCNWSTIAEPPTARGFMPALALNDIIYGSSGVIEE
jgi:hypothetical protein